ncbi:MAG: lasso peptide biosynthesis B2 protein, partial [Gemmatimonadales bacterium]|nr:lasso peptide biosynthesis B2 protein [Gemmatimonadales bacterium]
MPVPVWKLIGKLIRLSPGEWGALFQAQAALVAAQVMVWTQPQGRLVSRVSAPTTEVPARAEDERRAESLARAVNRVARYGLFRPRCLVRAIGLRRLLASHGMDATVRIGVRQREGRFDAHA